MGTPVGQVAEQFSARFVAVPVPQNLKVIDGVVNWRVLVKAFFRQNLCAGCASPRFVASFVLVPEPLNLKGVVGVGLTRRLSAVRGSLSSTSGRAVLCGHVSKLPRRRSGSMGLLPACKLHTAFCVLVLSVSSSEEEVQLLGDSRGECYLWVLGMLASQADPTISATMITDTDLFS